MKGTRLEFDDFKVKYESDVEVSDVVIGNVKMLFNAIRIPQKGNTKCLIDTNRLSQLGIAITEPVDWTNIGFSSYAEVSKDKYHITIRPAAPNQCPTLCAYLRSYLLSYGWDCNIETEWELSINSIKSNESH